MLTLGWDFGLRLLDFEIWTLGLGFWTLVSGLDFWTLVFGLDFWTLDFEIWSWKEFSFVPYRLEQTTKFRRYS